MDTIQNNSGQKNLGQKNITKRTGIKKPMSAELMSADMHLSVPGVQTAEVSPDLDECIRLCWQARHTVQRTLVEHCLSKGGKYVGPTHVQSMLDCMDICQAAADFMTRGSPLHTSVCAAAANVADACADSARACNPMMPPPTVKCSAAPIFAVPALLPAATWPNRVPRSRICTLTARRRWRRNSPASRPDKNRLFINPDQSLSGNAKAFLVIIHNLCYSDAHIKYAFTQKKRRL